MDMEAALSSQKAAKRATDPDDRMMQNLEDMRINPVAVAAGCDDRLEHLHIARFLGGPVCSSQQLWLMARDRLGATGVEPLAAYDMDSIGLGGVVTSRGWIELHAPGSNNLSMKLFNVQNVGNSTQATKRLTLADTDGSINVGESLREISSLEEFKLALRAAREAMAMALPWNRSIAAISGFMHISNFCATDLGGRGNRTQLLTDFVNYLFGLNAARWRGKTQFLQTADISAYWVQWFGSRPSSMLEVKQDNSHFRKPKGFSSNSNFNVNNNSNSSKARAAPNGQEEFCNRFNKGACPSMHNNCFTAAGTKLLHLCNADLAAGGKCRQKHPNAQHK